MAYYLDIFSPETFETFSASDRSITGFRQKQLRSAQRIHPGDKLICYMTKLSRWIGVLEVVSEYFADDEPRFCESDDPFVVRFRVEPLAWLAKEQAVPIHEDEVWSRLSFTREHDKAGSTWTGKYRSSLSPIDDEDGLFLEHLILSQRSRSNEYPVDEAEYRKFLTQRVRRADGLVTVSVPEDTVDEPADEEHQETFRESIQMQAELARIGEKMGFTIWLPKADSGKVTELWEPGRNMLLDNLPLNYDETTIRTIEQIDVLWLKKRSIARAFEVEHTTSIYSGILRMADLLALQPNMDIKLHIVAPYERRDKVFQELQRPVFSLVERGPLSELCTYISYDALRELGSEAHLGHLSDSVLEEYEEMAE